MKRKIVLLFFLFSTFNLAAFPVQLGVDRFFETGKVNQLKNKKIALVTNHTGVDRKMCSTFDRLLNHQPSLKLVALFSPEHGLKGNGYAFEQVKEKRGPNGIPVFHLHGDNRRPSVEMLKGIDVILYDIQDVGCRSYTYITTLFYVMEEAAKLGISVIVLDRPNPINGMMVDGPMLEEKYRSFIGYIDIPYCHGMTIGELASYFNEQYKVGCNLEVIPMRGWKRSMSYKDTGLVWIPTSPYIPESDTPLYYATTGILGEMGLVNIGIGYTLPFKVVGAPWIDAARFAKLLNEQQLPGVWFHPFYYRPFYGLYKGKDCQGVMIAITDPLHYRPVTTQYMILGILKILYPKQVLEKVSHLEEERKSLFCKANGNDKILSLLQKERYVAWKLIQYQKEKRDSFRLARRPYLLYEEG